MIRLALGVYVTGAVSPAERARVDQHLAVCRKCRNELAGLAGLPGLLSKVAPYGTEGATGGTLPAVPWTTVTARDAATNVSAQVRFRSSAWGTQLDVSVSGVPYRTRQWHCATRCTCHAPGSTTWDFTADGQHAVASCEFSAQLLDISLPGHKAVNTMTLGEPTDLQWFPGASQPQDVRLAPDGTVFYVADLTRNGVWLIDAARFRKVGFIHTGMGAHGLLISRDGKDLFASNRDAGTVSVISFATRTVIRTWHIPGGGSPDMGGITPDGKVIWLSGRYNGVVYAISAEDGRLIAKIPVGAGPHGVSVFPQPGRYPLGHTGNFR